jgi:hypothetical protein
MPTSTAIPKHLLSKSTFMYGCQCPKRLWLHKHMPDERGEMSSGQSAIFAHGTDVGLIAREIFPGGIDASPVDPFHYQQSVADTREYITNGHTTIYEAAFQYEGILAALDILIQHKGKWYGYEVKSSTKVKEPFLQDVALQYYVITKSGLPLEDIYIVHLNNSYVRKGALDLSQLFTRTSVKQKVLAKQTFIASKEQELKRVVACSSMPDVTTGKQCKSPYECDFLSFCSKDLQEAAAAEKPDSINKKEIEAFLSQLTYPLYFMDFETYKLAVPGHDGHWPYRQVPFQYSVHKLLSKDCDLEHSCFLAEDDCDPCPEFSARLIKELGAEGSIIVYNKAFENTRLNELKQDFPQFYEAIESIQSRIIDLMTPFKKRYYSVPAMLGKYSIKNVLPALIPEMSYDELEIGNGTDASVAFYNLRFEMDAEKIKATREALLDYCKLDTLAMVKILEKVQMVV